MKRFFTLVVSVLILSLFSFSSFGQEKDFSILLNSGKFIPAENISTLNKNSASFQKSLFGDRYYLVIQFNTLPSEVQKLQLKADGIYLIDYIPNYAFTASIDKNFSILK